LSGAVTVWGDVDLDKKITIADYVYVGVLRNIPKIFRVISFRIQV